MTEVIATIRDTATPSAMAIDNTYQGVLAYRDGPYRWQPAQIGRFLAAKKLVYPLSVRGLDPHLAQVVDCENGDLTVAQAVQWVQRRNDLHHDGTVYISESRLPTLLDTLGSEPCWLWGAWWTGTPEIPSLALPKNVHWAAMQYANKGTDWDLSAIVSREWPASPYDTTAHW